MVHRLVRRSVVFTTAATHTGASSLPARRTLVREAVGYQSSPAMHDRAISGGGVRESGNGPSGWYAARTPRPRCSPTWWRARGQPVGDLPCRARPIRPGRPFPGTSMKRHRVRAGFLVDDRAVVVLGVHGILLACTTGRESTKRIPGADTPLFPTQPRSRLASAAAMSASSVQQVWVLPLPRSISILSTATARWRAPWRTTLSSSGASTVGQTMGYVTGWDT